MADKYAWLQDRDHPDVMARLLAENAETDRAMEPLRGLRETLYAEMLGRIKQTDLTVPARKGGYLYYSRTEEGKQYPIVCRRQGTMERPEEVLLDLNALAAGRAYLALGEFEVSDDSRMLAYSLDTTGHRDFTLYVRNLMTRATIGQPIERVSSIVWAADSRTVFYTTEDPVSKRSHKFWRHLAGSEAFELIFEETDELYDLSVTRSSDRRAIFLASAAKTSTEYRYLPADEPNDIFTVVLRRLPNHEYDVEHFDDRFYIRSNRNAKNFRVVTTTTWDTSEHTWRPFIDHNPAIKIEHLQFFQRHLVVVEKENGIDYLRVVDMGSGASHRIETDERDCSVALGQNLEFHTGTLRFTYQSMVTPISVYDYDMRARTRTLLKRQPVLGGYAASEYEGRRVWAVARDSTKVPVSVVYKKSTRLDGTAPLLLHGYGAYGISLGPTFSSERLSLLDRGAVFATAYVRGGGEMGEDWRDEGRLMRKMNSFTDFIDCAEFLIKQKFTSADRLVSHGASAGGLLVGAAVNMRPDLFKAVVAEVPFLDVVNTMLDPSLPLTTGEYLEWGDPRHAAVREYMLRYSPYDTIRAQAYPAMLVRVSLHDSQVPFWEGVKFVARLRELKTDQNPQLLKVNFGAGHSGSSGRYDALRETALTYAFMLWQMGGT